MMDAAELRRRAQRKLRAIQRRRRDPRYVRVLGRLAEAGYIITRQAVVCHRDPLEVAEVLWAGEIEPRFLELLPALLVKQPSFFVDARQLPGDLESVVRKLRRNMEPEAFRGISGDRLLRRLSEVGRTRGVPARLKSFRLRADDLRLLKALAVRLGVSETEVVRRAIRTLL
jgi:hypothetical protein